MLWITSWLLWLSVIALAQQQSQSSGPDKPKLHTTIVVYVEGLSHNLLQSNANSNNPMFSDVGFRKLAENGITAQYLLPEFPTLSATNFFSMFSGVYPEHHGVYSDTIYDVSNHQGIRLERFDQTYAQAPIRWNKTTFVWDLALQQGVPTSMYYWRYCPKPHKLLTRCTEHITPNSKGLSLFIANVIEDISSRGTRLIMIDIDSVGRYGAQFGLTHPTTIRSIQEVSNMLYELQNALAEFNKLDDVNLVVVSDHGLIDSSHDKYTFIDDYLDTSLVDKIVFEGALAWIYPAANKSYQIEQVLSDSEPGLPHCTLHWSNSAPARWRLPPPAAQGKPGMAPLLLLCQPGYAISCRMPCKEFPKLPTIVTNEHFPRALAGYDNAAPSMKAVFMARGPDIIASLDTDPQSHTTGWLRSVDVFETLCRLLSISCSDGHNGDLDRVGQVVAAANQRQASHWVLTITTTVLLLLMTR